MSLERTVRWRGHQYPVVLPRAADPRLHLAAIVVALHVLGQTVLHFDVSIAQILVAIGSCALAEFLVTFVRDRVIAWPASAMLTGSGVAFVLRVPGTRHGDWWSLRGAWIFAAAGLIGLLLKYVLRVDGRPLFNPSNIGLVVVFIALGPRRTEPLDFWWVRPGAALAIALVIIVVGGVWLVWRVGMMGVAISFWLTFAAGLGVLAARGHCITARWHVGPLCGEHFWSVLVTSPEVLVFLFLMITDPKTAPRGRRARMIFGALIALFAVFLAAPQHTEFQTKVALLAALVFACVLRPVLERRFADHVVVSGATPARRAVVVLACVSAGVVLLVGAGAPARTVPRTPSAAVVPKHCAKQSPPARRRPNVRVDAALVQRTTIGVPTNVSGTISVEKGQEIARDTMADLAIIERAVRQSDAGLAATAATGPLLDALTRRICAATTRPPAPITAANRLAHRVRVSLYKRTAGQASAEIDVDVRSASARRAATFRVEWHGGAYLIAAVVER